MSLGVSSSRPLTGRLAPPLIAFALSLLVGVVGPIASIVPVPVARGADTDLTVVTNATYTVQPTSHRVHVTVDILARNHRAETRTKKYYVDRGYLAVLPGTSGFRIAGHTGAHVRVARKTTTYTLLRIDFGARLYGGSSRKLRLTFDLRDRGGAANRSVRVAGSLVSFPVWAYASNTASGSTVAVSFPSGYEVTVETGQLPVAAPGSSGRVVLRSGRIAKPLSFFAYVVAERTPAYADTAATVGLGDQQVELTLRAWKDDPAWAKRTRQLFTRSLPVLRDAIGIAWPRATPTIVQEAVNRTAGGYAGLFDPAAGRIEVAYWADHLVTIHEAAHGWFNGGLLADRWANEGFASRYAAQAAKKLKERGKSPALTPAVAKARIPLNAWAPAGQGDRATEQYGYAASLALAKLIAERAGDDVLRRVWADAAARVGAYQPDERPGIAVATRSSTSGELVGAAPDWRGLLDLLETHSGKDFSDLWRTWVVRDDEAPLLDARAESRSTYSRTLALTDGWALPRGIRDALRAWQFDAAQSLMADARTVLAQRAAVESRAATDGLTLPSAMRTAFEAGSFADASAAAQAEMATMVAIEAATDAEPVTPDPLTQVGLLGSTPDIDLVAARASLASGDLDAGAAAADRALRTWDAAWQEGRRRLILAIAVLATVIVLGSALVGRLARLRRSGAGSTVAATGSPDASPPAG